MQTGDVPRARVKLHGLLDLLDRLLRTRRRARLLLASAHGQRGEQAGQAEGAQREVFVLDRTASDDATDIVSNSSKEWRRLAYALGHGG